jgi:pyrroloquinoline quinone (PQQ) biosynthesis protein C
MEAAMISPFDLFTTLVFLLLLILIPIAAILIPCVLCLWAFEAWLKKRRLIKKEKLRLEIFIEEWQDWYSSEAKTVPLFNQEKTLELTQKQKDVFVRLFYHARGHFSRFLWTLGNSAPSSSYKKVVINNIKEELGAGVFNLPAHEELYANFAGALGVNILEEALSEQTYLDFLQEFNRQHVTWLLSHDWDHKWAAFSAYELLDNVDYENLFIVAKGFGLPADALTFFEVHRGGDHFEKTKWRLQEIWQRNPEAVRAGFEFIGNHQIAMWKKLSADVSECKEV